ncbi:MAG TPA: LamG domain-containing protein, partial [Candidatus Woesebacteria bacterium]|nr:LamG domain-containing protein [Candidatus Woesebacteria bacterium]
AVFDTSGNNNTGTMMNGPIPVQGKFGKAMRFDGVNARIIIPDSPSLSLTTAITVSAWVKASDATGGGRGVVTKGPPNSDYDYMLYLTTSGDKADFYIKDSTGNIGTAGLADAIWDDDKWHYFAGIYDGDFLYLYYDGRLVSSTDTPLTTIRDSSENLLIGRGWNISFTGSIDQVRIYNYARTPAQIAWEYNRGAPVAWYQFNECSGTTAYNAARNGNNDPAGNNGTIVIGSSGSQTSAGTCDTSGAWANGKDGKRNASLNFDGNDDYVQVTDHVTLKSSAFSVTMWINAHSLNTRQGIVTKRRNSGDGFSDFEWRFGFREEAAATNQNNQLEFTWYSSNAADRIASKQLFTTDRWYHTVFTHTGTESFIYIDGKLDNTKNTSVAYDSNKSGNSLWIGSSRLNLRPFNGQIDDVKIYNYALTPEQIKLDYNGGAVRFE